EGLGDRFVLPLVGALLARAIYEQGRADEATELHSALAKVADPKDVETQALLSSVEALVLLHAEEVEQAEAAAERAVAFLNDIESHDLRADCLVMHARTVAASGRKAEALTILEQALELYTLKGNVVSTERTRAMISELAEVAGRTG
ncbi:MAG TPA: tetratricopeptide repeat protein, partial [Gaiellaceae bacterium]|nr:tetratricopeptide repeat protein [Gaiellaceae bacterium]